MDRLQTLAIFIAVAERSSFTAAARRLRKTPASISRAVRELEESLGTRLLNRTTRSVSLTEAGVRYLEACRRVVGAHEDLLRIELGDGPRAHGSISVTAPTVFGRLHVVPVLQPFLAAHPELDVELLLVDRVVSLVDEGIDAGVRLGALPDSSLVATRVGQVRFGIWASPAYLEKHGEPRSVRDLASHTTIGTLLRSTTAQNWRVRVKGRTVPVVIHPRLVVNTPDGAIAAAAAGLGLSYLPSYQTAPEVAAGRLVPVLPRLEYPLVPIHIVQPAGRFPPEKVRAFVTEVGAALRQRLSGSGAW